MSTKTSIKRIAAVAAVALTLGGFSAVSAHAAGTVTGVGASGVAFTNTTVAALTTPGTATNPVAVTAVAGKSVKLGFAGTAVQADITYTAFTTADFSTTAFDTNAATFKSDYITSGADLTGGAYSTLLVPAAGTYYIKLDGTTSAGYVKLTSVRMRATTYDGSTTAGLGTTAPAGVAGPANSVTLTLGKGAQGFITVSGTGSTFQNPLGGGTVKTVVAVNGLSATVGSATADATGNDNVETIQVTTPVVGSVVVNFYKYLGSGSYATTATETVTITVAATASSGVYNAAQSSIYMAATDTSTITAATDAIPVVARKDASTAVATIEVKYTDSLGNPITSGTVYGSIAGAGNIIGSAAFGDSHAQVTNQYTSSVASDGDSFFWVYANGQSGVATVTFTDALNVVLGTKTITFSGTKPATMTPTVYRAYIPSSGTAYGTGGTSTTSVFKVVLKDSSGNVVSGITPTATAADTSKVSAVTCSGSGSTGNSYCSATGVAGATGKTTVTFSYGTAAGGDLVTATADVTVSSVKASTLTITADSSVSSGQVVTYTITAKDANGLPIPDGSSALDYLLQSPTIAGGAMQDFGSTANAGLTSNKQDVLFTGVTFLGGVATDSVQAPFGSTSLVATFDLQGTAGVPSSVLTGALAAAETVLTTVVGGDTATQASVDAAQEATDAANAAYDAANNAMDSADAATAAAQDASDNASAALAAVTSLSATVAKLVASVSAITSALASIKKKLGVK